MITVTIQGSPEDVRHEMMGLLGLTEIPTGPPAERSHQEPEPTKKTAKEEKPSPKETVKKSVEPTEKPTSEPKSEPKTDEPLTIETIKGIVPKLMVKVGREKVVALLGEFGVKKGSEVQEKDFASFMKKATALLA